MNLSRRDLLKATASAAVTSSALTGFAQNNPDQKIILGEGDHKYECVHDWLTPPEGMLFGDTHGVAQDSEGRMYVCHTVHPDSKINDAVVVYDSEGGFLKSWGSEFKGGAHGLDLRKEGNQEFLYHCDTNRSLVVKTDLNGKVIWQQGAPAEADVYKDGKRYVPTNVCFLPDGDLLVGDGYGSSYIHRYTKDGEYKKTFCTKGAEKGQVNCPHGLWLDERGKEPVIIVADRSNNRLQRFNLDMEHIDFVTDQMRLPCHAHIQGDLTLVPHLQSVIALLDPDGKTIAWLGDGHPTNLRGKPKSDFIPGKFIHPHDAMFLDNGDILVAEWVPQGRITLLKTQKR